MFGIWRFSRRGPLENPIHPEGPVGVMLPTPALVQGAHGLQASLTFALLTLMVILSFDLPVVIVAELTGIIFLKVSTKKLRLSAVIHRNRFLQSPLAVFAVILSKQKELTNVNGSYLTILKKRKLYSKEFKSLGDGFLKDDIENLWSNIK